MTAGVAFVEVKRIHFVAAVEVVAVDEETILRTIAAFVAGLEGETAQALCQTAFRFLPRILLGPYVPRKRQLHSSHRFDEECE
jgi:hypothetical protein